MTSQIGFLGLGQMGAAIAERLEGPDVQLHVHDPSPTAVQPFVSRGARACSGPRAVADAADIVFACLPSPSVSLLVAEQVVQGRAIATYVEMSTVGRPAVEQIAATLRKNTIGLVDAPVSGGPDAARAGRIAVMAAGATPTLESVDVHLRRVAGSLFVVGDSPGLGQAMKLVNNLVAAALVATTTEAVVAGAKAGLAPEMMMHVLNHSSGQSSVSSGLLPTYVLTGRFDFGATIDTLIKDIELGLAETAAVGVSTPTLRAVHDRWRFAAQHLGGSADLTMLAHLLESESGVLLRSTPGID